MRLRVRNTGDTIELDITIPSADPTEVWSFSATQQDFGAVTGGRLGDPISLTPGVLPPLAFNPAEGGFATAGDVANTDNLTQGISYTQRAARRRDDLHQQGLVDQPVGDQLRPRRRRTLLAVRTARPRSTVRARWTSAPTMRCC